MCGIAGVIGNKNQEVSLEKVNRMLEVLNRRGPNDMGVEVWDTAVLGHRRLSIFDLSAAGHQPMLSPQGDIGLVFNGAIYNFRALRAELEARGYHFQSQTDTEVLIYGYQAWGFDKLVAKIEGMFAIGLWDDRQKTLFLVRDRLGVKPLAFAIQNGQISFASTTRALRKAKLGGDLNDQGVIEYLEFGFLADKHAIYKGIEKVRAGEIVEWHNGKIEKREYWTLPEVSDVNRISFNEAVEETERLFLQAVEKRLQSDVPIGALLSGGIDSSLVCWAITELGGDVTAFTVGTPNDRFDETTTAAQTAKFLGIKHQVLEFSSEKTPNIDELVEAYAEPFACASALGMLEISRKVKKSATVLLTGDGGDDIFLGYPEHKHFFQASKIARKMPALVADMWFKTRENIPKSGNLKRAVSFLDYSMGGLGAVSNARDGLPIYWRNNLLGEKLRNVSLPDRQLKWTLESGRNLLKEFLIYDRQTRFVGEYLPKVDGSTMFNALEARSPFLDTKLWEFAAKLPYALRLHQGKSKAILREIVRRKMGERLSTGKKQGFIIPVQKWLTENGRGYFTELLDNSLLEKEGWISRRPVLELLEHSAERKRMPRQLWFIFVLESWMRFEKNLPIR